MRKKVTLVLMLISIAFTLFGISVYSEKREVIVVDELDITRSSPEITVIDNNLFILEILPNRGRILWRIFSKGTDNTMSYLYTNSEYPMPFLDDLTSQYIFELGGLYISVPWNERSNQPYPLNGWIDEEQNTVLINLYGLNPVENLSVEITVKIKEMDPIIPIIVTIKNDSTKEKPVNFAQYINFNFKPPLSLISGNKELNGKQIGDYENYLFKKLFEPTEFIGIVDKNGNGIKINLGSETEKYIQIWGKNWEQYFGGAPAVRFINLAEEFVLQPEESKTSKIILEFLTGE